MDNGPHGRARRLASAAGAILMAVGIADAVAGLALLAASARTVLEGPFVTVPAVVGAPVLVLSVVEFVGGTRAYRGRNFHGVLAAAGLGTVAYLPLTLDLVGAFVLFRLSGQLEGVGAASVILLVTLEQVFGFGVVTAVALGVVALGLLRLLDLLAIALVASAPSAFDAGVGDGAAGRT